MMKILFITTEFWNAGAERYLFEIDASISKDLFNTSILSLRDLKSDTSKDDYYYNKHVELGTQIYFLNTVNIRRKPTIKERLKRKLFGTILPNERKPLIDFLAQFHRLIFIGEYTYPFLSRWLTEDNKKTSYICVVNSIYQVFDNYIKYNKDEKVQFISGFTEEEGKVEFGGFKNYSHLYFPLSIKCNNKAMLWKTYNHKIKRIGIFTRLTSHKPLDIFYYALHILLKNKKDVQLYVFGNGNPENFEFNRCIKYLSLENFILFKGHQNNIIQAAIDYEIDLVWFHGYHAFPGGYASFDLASIGVPQLFWNFTPNSKKSLCSDFPMFNDLIDFTLKSKEVLENYEIAKELGIKQFEHITRHRDMNKNIVDFEKLML